MQITTDTVSDAITCAVILYGDGKNLFPTIEDCALSAMDTIGEGHSLSREQCEKAILVLDRIWRDNGYAYVGDSFRREDRKNIDYRIGSSLRNILSLRSMNGNEKSALGAMLENRMAGIILSGKPAGADYPFPG